MAAEAVWQMSLPSKDAKFEMEKEPRRLPWRNPVFKERAEVWGP